MPQRGEEQILAQYTSIASYVPKYGDFVVWSGWFRNWFGTVNGISKDGVVSIIMEGTPALLFTLSDGEMRGNSKNFNLSDIRAKRRGSWSVCQHGSSGAVWYI